MASGQTLCVFTPAHGVPPSSSYATFDTRNGHLVLDFDAAADEAIIFTGILPRNYSGGGIDVILLFALTSATSGTVRWTTAFERVNDESLDIDADSFATAKTGGGAAPGTSGQVQYFTIQHSNSEIDGLLAGEMFRLKVSRDADGTSGTDDATGDSELLAVELKET